MTHTAAALERAMNVQQVLFGAFSERHRLIALLPQVPEESSRRGHE